MESGKSWKKFAYRSLLFLSGTATVFLTACSEQTQSDTALDEPGAEKVTLSDWPLFRGDSEMQGRSVESIPTPLKMAWTFEPAVEEGKRRPPVDASPVVVDGKVFVGTQAGQFYSIDLATGEEIWNFKAEGPVSAPGAVLDEKVFFGDTYGFVYALSVVDGSEIWRFETEGKIEGGVNIQEVEGGPDQIFVGSHDYYLYSLDSETGKVLWKYETGNYIVATPSLIQSGGNDAICFGGCDGLLHVVPASGKGAKKEVEIGSYIANTSAVSDGISYVAHNGGEIVAVEIATGETVWTIKTGIEYTASPAVDEKNLYVAGPDKRLVAYDRILGEEVWSFRARRSLDSSPVIAGEIIWQGGMDGRLYAVDRNNGSEVWSFELGTQIKASPAVSRGTLVVCGDDGLVYGFTAK